MQLRVRVLQIETVQEIEETVIWRWYRNVCNLVQPDGVKVQDDTRSYGSCRHSTAPSPGGCALVAAGIVGLRGASGVRS
jgi:hypothetical protein